MKRLFLESDILIEDELGTCQCTVELIHKKKGITIDNPEVFDVVIDKATWRLKEVWDAIKDCDEIYSNSSLLPLGGSYNGSPLILDKMCENCIKEDIRGKSLYFLVPIKSVSFGWIDLSNLKMALTHNKLYAINHDTWEFDEINPKSLKD